MLCLNFKMSELVNKIAPSRNCITSLVRKFEKARSVLDNLKGLGGCRRSVCNEENVQ